MKIFTVKCVKAPRTAGGKASTCCFLHGSDRCTYGKGDGPGDGIRTFSFCSSESSGVYRTESVVNSRYEGALQRLVYLTNFCDVYMLAT